MIPSRESLFSPEHLAMWATIMAPLGSGILWVLLRQARQIEREAQNQVKLDTMWNWFTNHGSDVTGYKPGDERKR